MLLVMFLLYPPPLNVNQFKFTAKEKTKIANILFKAKLQWLHGVLQRFSVKFALKD